MFIVQTDLLFLDVVVILTGRSLERLIILAGWLLWPVSYFVRLVTLAGWIFWPFGRLFKSSTHLQQAHLHDNRRFGADRG